MPKGHVRDVKAPPPPPAPPKDPTQFTCDTVEGHEWFGRLTAAQQAEIRDLAEAKRTRHVERAAFAKTSRKRAMVKGALVFLANETLFAMPSWGHSAAALFVGAGVGALWHAAGAGRFRCALLSVVPYAALRIAFPGDSPTAAAVYGVLGLATMLSLSALIGFEREHRRADDLDY